MDNCDYYLQNNIDKIYKKIYDKDSHDEEQSSDSSDNKSQKQSDQSNSDNDEYDEYVGGKHPKKRSIRSP